MKEMIDKISSYNLFNNLLPGIMYVYLISCLTDFNLMVDNLLWGVFVYYFVGLVISRVGSLIIDPILKKIRFIKKSKSYDDYLNALTQDTKINLFLEINNMYRTIVALLLLVLITIGIDWLINHFAIPLFHLGIAVILGLFILFLFAYRKQINYIKQRISVVKNKNDKKMSKIKSFSVGNGDMFYIKHSSSNFSIIDCFLCDENKNKVVDELINESCNKDITRFISTHSDEDHIQQLNYLDDRMPIINFYCVQNEVTKKDETNGFKRYCKLRDIEKAFYLYKGCNRKWMNEEGNDDSGKYRSSANINILWPNTNNDYYKDALQKAKNGESPNNISPIITYSIKDGVTYQWMGDLETDFMENIKDDVSLSKVNILFAPHHGRDSGKIPESMLNIL